MSLDKLETVVVIQVNKRKKVDKGALVVEGFKEKYIIVRIDDDHQFTLKWTGFMYEGKFLDMTMTCQYNVERDFSATITNKNSSGIKPVVLKRRTSGRP